MNNLQRAAYQQPWAGEHPHDLRALIRINHFAIGLSLNK